MVYFPNETVPFASSILCLRLLYWTEHFHLCLKFRQFSMVILFSRYLRNKTIIWCLLVLHNTSDTSGGRINLVSLYLSVNAGKPEVMEFSPIQGLPPPVWQSLVVSIFSYNWAKYFVRKKIISNCLSKCMENNIWQFEFFLFIHSVYPCPLFPW